MYIYIHTCVCLSARLPYQFVQFAVVVSFKAGMVLLGLQVPIPRSDFACPVTGAKAKEPKRPKLTAFYPEIRLPGDRVNQRVGTDRGPRAVTCQHWSYQHSQHASIESREAYGDMDDHASIEY